MGAGFVFKDVSFSRLPEGWIFTVRGGPDFLVHRSYLVNRSYLVDDAQKAELLARINRWRVVWYILVASIVAALVAGAANLSHSGFSHWIVPAVVASIFLQLAMVLYGAAIPYIQWFLLRPILAGAPPPTGFWSSLLLCFGFWEARTSTRWLVLSCVSFGALSVDSALTANGDYALPILWIYVTAQSGAGLFLKLRAKRFQEQPAATLAGEHDTQRDKP
jgi:hypothetical protein